MAWLKSHQGLERHPKVLHLEELCSTDRNGTVGVLHRFWYWAMDYAEDGDLSKWTLATISKAIGIDANHLVSAGFIDQKPYLKIHDWFEYFGEYLRGKYRREPEKYEVIKKKCLGTDSVQNRTNTVVDKIRGEERRKEKKQSVRFEKPTAAQVDEYARSISFELVGQTFVDYYETKGWVVGRSPMKNWKAAVRTWKSRRSENGQGATGNQPVGRKFERKPSAYDGVTETHEVK